MNKVIFVEAPFKSILDELSVSVPTGEIKKGFFGREKEVARKERKVIQTGVSNSKIDGIALGIAIDQAVSSLNQDGYEIVSITPVTSGSYDFREISSSMATGQPIIEGGGYGYGFSFTSGVLLLGRKLEK